MRKKFQKSRFCLLCCVALLLMCLLPFGASAAMLNMPDGLPADISMAVVDEDSLMGDLDLTEMKYDDHEQTVYRPIMYVVHQAGGDVVRRYVETKPMLTVTYRFCYGINRNGEYVLAGGNPVPTLGGFAGAPFNVSAQHVMNTTCDPDPLPGNTGYTYTFAGGYFTMTYNNTIHVDEQGDFLYAEQVESEGIAYRCTFTHP